MDRLDLDDIELTYELSGADAGERVVLVHATAFVSWYGPLLEQLPELSTLTYRRRLRRTADSRYRPLTVGRGRRHLCAAHGRDRVVRAHIVGHSYGALVALQLALDRPERVGSVVLLEPAARGISSSAAVAAALQPVIAAYRSGDVAGAVDGFLRHVCGDGYRSALERVLPGAFAEALAEADLFFQAEMAAVQQWSFGPSDAEHVTQPVLNVLGAESASRFVEGAALVQSWFPDAERLAVPAAGHLLMVQNPTAVARGLEAHIARHPIGLGTSTGER